MTKKWGDYRITETVQLRLSVRVCDRIGLRALVSVGVVIGLGVWVCLRPWLRPASAGSVSAPDGVGLRAVGLGCNLLGDIMSS